MQAKAWAQHHNLNDPSSGTFNSHALTLMMLHHLQRCNPPVMPPMRNVLLGTRPLQHGAPPDQQYPLDLVRLKCQALGESGFSSANATGTGTLFLTFLVRFMALTAAWTSGSANNVRVNTFDASLSCEPFLKRYIMLVEVRFFVLFLLFFVTFLYGTLWIFCKERMACLLTLWHFCMELCLLLYGFSVWNCMRVGV